VTSIVARKGDVTIDDRTGPTTLAQGQQTTVDESQKQKKKRRRNEGAVAPASRVILDSPWAIGADAAAVAGLTTWVLIQGGAPVSPMKP
jgi:hypothetical protein